MTDIAVRAKAALEQALADRPTTIEGARQSYTDIAEAVSLMPELIDEVNRLHEVANLLRRDQIVFADTLGFGDNVTEPAATLPEMVGPIQQAFADASEHVECRKLCEQCGEWLADTVCPGCHGSGIQNALECGLCRGGGWVHDGCAGKPYAELVVELDRLRAGVTVERRVVTPQGASRALRDGEALGAHVQSLGWWIESRRVSDWAREP